MCRNCPRKEEKSAEGGGTDVRFSKDFEAAGVRESFVGIAALKRPKSASPYAIMIFENGFAWSEDCGKGRVEKKKNRDKVFPSKKRY